MGNRFLSLIQYTLGYLSQTFRYFSTSIYLPNNEYCSFYVKINDGLKIERLWLASLCLEICLQYNTDWAERSSWKSVMSPRICDVWNRAQGWEKNLIICRCLSDFMNRTHNVSIDVGKAYVCYLNNPFISICYYFILWLNEYYYHTALN